MKITIKDLANQLNIKEHVIRNHIYNNKNRTDLFEFGRPLLINSKGVKFLKSKIRIKEVEENFSQNDLIELAVLRAKLQEKEKQIEDLKNQNDKLLLINNNHLNNLTETTSNLKILEIENNLKKEEIEKLKSRNLIERILNK